MRLALLVSLTACDPTPRIAAPSPSTELHRPAAAARAVARVTEPPRGLMPAGTCGFDPYLREACAAGDDAAPAPTYAVVTSRADDPRAAEAALRETPRFGGYPFAVSFDDLPAADASARGIAVVAGLFGQREDADAYALALGRAEVLPLATVAAHERRLAAGTYANEDDREKHIRHVVELAGDTPAYDAADLGRTESALDEALGAHWVRLPAQQGRRAAALARLRPRCTLPAGRVFVTDGQALYGFRRMYAPVTCDDGSEAWVPWRATRLESAVLWEGGAWKVHQVILVECDVPTVETRPLGLAPPGLGPITEASCE